LHGCGYDFLYRLLMNKSKRVQWVVNVPFLSLHVLLDFLRHAENATLADKQFVSAQDEKFHFGNGDTLLADQEMYRTDVPHPLRHDESNISMAQNFPGLLTHSRREHVLGNGECK
jgi:hypothetical protein